MPVDIFGRDVAKATANVPVKAPYQSIPHVFSESEFDELPAGHYGCYTSYIPATRMGSLPPATKGYLITLTYQQPVDRNKYYKWINSTNGDEWTAYFRNGSWNTWVKSVNMTGDLNMNGKLVKGLPVNYPPTYGGDEAVSWAQVHGLITDATRNNNTIPSGDNYLTNKKYVDERIDNLDGELKQLRAALNNR